jgi:hypothetical protein
MSSFRNVVGFTDTIVAIKVKKFLILQDVIQFSIDRIRFSKESVGYKLQSLDGSVGEIAINYDRSKKMVTVWLTYVGKHEKQLKSVFEQTLEAMRTQFLADIEKTKRKKSDLSHKLSLFSYVAKLVSTSKLLGTEALNTGQMDVSTFLIDTVHKYAQYPIVLLVGVGTTGTFRVLLSNGEVKGAYAKLGDKEMFGDDALKNLKGEFKISIYANLTGSVKEILTE